MTIAGDTKPDAPARPLSNGRIGTDEALFNG